MSLVGIIIFFVFVALLAKAILETIWGICLIIQGLLYHAIALALNLLAMTLRGFKRLRPKRTASPRRRNPVVAGLARIQ